MKKDHYKPKVSKIQKGRLNQRVETTLNLRVDKALKDRFLSALQVGRPATMTDAIEHLMVAYCESTERDGKQPEFPLEVRSKGAQ